jgi:hypothetical protein
MYWFYLRDREIFYIRLLLTRVRGPTSFNNLRIVDRTLYETFKGAYIALGLLVDDKTWRACF